jgi:hypothetical protein
MIISGQATTMYKYDLTEWWQMIDGEISILPQK